MRNFQNLGWYIILALGASMFLASCMTQVHAVYQQKPNGDVVKLRKNQAPDCIQNW